MTSAFSNQDLMDVYINLTPNEKEIINLLVVKLVPTGKKEISRVVQDWLPSKLTQAAIVALVESLVEKSILINSDGLITVDYVLQLDLLPALIKQVSYNEFITNLKRNFYSWNNNSEEMLREFLFAAFENNTSLVINSADKYKVSQVLAKPHEYYAFFVPMLASSDYNPVFQYNSDFTFQILRISQRQAIYGFSFLGLLAYFFEREPFYNDINQQSTIQYAEIKFFIGRISEAQAHVAHIENHDALLLKSTIALFKGDYQATQKLFDQARTTGFDGTRRSKPPIYLERELFYWLSFVFDSSKFKPEKAEIAINKLLKNKTEDSDHILALLYFLKKDLEKANRHIDQCSFNIPSLSFWFKLIISYVIKGKLERNDFIDALGLLNILIEKQIYLLIPDLIFMLEASGFKLNEEVIAIKNNEYCKTFQPLTCRIVKQEVWEMQLEGLAQLFSNQKAGTEKIDKTNRVCYLVNLDKEIIQPILQTYNAKTGWTAGRNIALKKMRLGEVEGMTDQDKHIASTIGIYSNYYGSDTFDFNFRKAINELCGHPLLFLFANPSVSVELIKAEPEIYTEENGNKITLKTNIESINDENFQLIKETQTRFKLIVLNPKQKEIIQIINKGITIPSKGKEKLLATVSKLSGVLTVHSHLAEKGSTVKTIDADPKIRIQIVPMGDGLKAEMFVKPLGSEPPYMKPGKGGKVVYGTRDGEKCQAIRKMENEINNANILNNAINNHLDVDLITDVTFFNNPYDCLELLETIAANANIAVVEWPEGERFKIRKSVSFGQMHLSVKRGKQWFELDGKLNVDEDSVLSIAELLKKNKESHGRFIELENGEYIALTSELKKQLNELESMAQVEKGKTTINPYATHILADLSEKVASFKTDTGWKELQQKIKNADLLQIELPATLDAELRPYQEEGFRWLVRLNEWGAGACLADDMGLGKTVQTIAMMLRLAETGPSIVVCPASVAANWRNELQKFAPTLNPVMLKAGSRDQAFDALSPFDVLIISYGLLQTEEENISKIKWAMVVLDEAHAIKNFQTKSSKAAMNIGAGFKVALTGTPVQNHLGELWNLFQFCNPGLLGTQQQFTNRYVKTEVAEQHNHLKKLIAPFILRRTKNKVLSELPAKTEITHAVELSKNEMEFYEALRRNAIAVIESNNGPGGQQHLQALAEITKLRLACCNTALVDKNVKFPSAKLAAFFEITDELRANNHRALVFSQFVGHLNIVRAELDKQNISYQYLDGSTSMPDRERAVKAFQSGKGDLFLISLKAGGLGLNLTAADYVIHLDPWWNPAIEDQASDRAHRMGQTRPVTIYRLVAQNTIEEKIVQLHATKRNMADSLLEGTDQGAKLSTLELLSLLKGV